MNKVCISGIPKYFNSVKEATEYFDGLKEEVRLCFSTFDKNIYLS